MKRYLIKMFEKIQHPKDQHSRPQCESPDPLMEHSNSVQEQSSTVQASSVVARDIQNKDLKHPNGSRNPVINRKL